MLFLEHYGLTDAGKVRRNNEDSLLVGDGRDTSLFAVADGIGGFEAGEVASRIAVEALKELEPEGSFETAIRGAHNRILDASRGDEKLSGMGTTVVAVRFSGTEVDPQAEVVHVGDSRAYLLRDGVLRQLTEDHSLVAELVRSGDLTRAQAADHPQKNLITRALGADEEVEVDTDVLSVKSGDRLLLCSDGLTDMLPEDRISEILSEPAEDPESPSRKLLFEALEAGGSDNVTIVLVDVKIRERPARGRDLARERPRRSRSFLDNDSGGTREMQIISRPAETEQEDESSTRRSSRRSRRSRATRRRSLRARAKRRRGNLYLKLLAWLVRLAALALVVLLALTPLYLWGGSQYYLAFENEEVVAYRGVPYELLGTELNEEWRKTGIEKSEVKKPYQQRIENHQLYSRDEVEEILENLRN